MLIFLKDFGGNFDYQEESTIVFVAWCNTLSEHYRSSPEMFCIFRIFTVFIQISSLIGQTLVDKFLTLCSYTFKAFQLTYSFFQVLCEDSLFFVKDAADKSTYVILTLKNIYSWVEEFVCLCAGGIYGVGEILSSLFGILLYTVDSIRYGVHHTGSTIWRFIALIPETVCFKIVCTGRVIKNTFEYLISLVFILFDKISQWVENIYLFFFDIPNESIYGLVIGAVLIAVLYIKFHSIQMAISRSIILFYTQIISFGITLMTALCECFLRRHLRNLPVEVEYDYDDYNDEYDFRLCVICQNDLKEIIIFPCKHLCVCKDCSLKLTKTQPMCPICRGKIGKTMKVYL